MSMPSSHYYTYSYLYICKNTILTQYIFILTSVKSGAKYVYLTLGPSTG